MSKKNMDLKFLVTITLEHKSSITKDLIRNYIEENAKGLKVKDIVINKNDKDMIFAEVKSNLHEMLFIVNTPHDSSIVSGATQEEINDKLLSCSMALESQLRLQKALNPNVLKLVNNIEVLAKASKEFPIRSKTKSDTALSTQFQSTLDKSEEIGNLKKIISNLEEDMHKLTQVNNELRNENDKLTQFGGQLLLEGMKKLENQIEEERSLWNEEKQRYNLLAAEILDKDDQINELRAALAGSGKIPTYGYGSKEAGATLKKLEEENESLNKSMKELEHTNQELKSFNKKMELDLVAALQDLAKFEGSTLGKEQRKKQLVIDKIMARRETDKVQNVIINMIKSINDLLNQQQQKLHNLNTKISILKPEYNELQNKLSVCYSELRKTEQRAIKAEQIKGTLDNILKDKEYYIHEMQDRVGALQTSNLILDNSARQYQSEAEAMQVKVIEVENQLKLAEDKINSLKKTISMGREEQVGAIDIVQKIWNGVNKMHALSFTKIIKSLTKVCDKVMVIAPHLQTLVAVQNSDRELLVKWKVNYDQLLKQTVILNDRIRDISIETIDKEDKLEQYKNQLNDLKKKIVLKESREQELVKRVHELEGILHKQDYHVKAIEADNKMLHEIYDKAMEKQSEVRTEIFDTNSKVQDTLRRYQLLTSKYQNDRIVIEKQLKRFFDKISFMMKKIQDAEVLVMQRIMLVSQKLTETGITKVRKMYLLFCELKRHKETSEAEIMKHSLEQERIQRKLNKNESQKIKLEQQAKQQESVIKVKTDSLVALNLKFIELTNKFKTEEAKSTILENYLQKNKQQCTNTINNLKTQFRIDYKRIEDFMFDRTKYIFTVIQSLISASKVLNKSVLLCDNLKKLNKKYVEAKNSIKEMQRIRKEQDNQLQERIKAETLLKEQLNNEMTKTKQLQNELKEVKDKQVITISNIKKDFKIQYKKLLTITLDKAKKIINNISSILIRQNDNAEERHKRIIKQFQSFKNMYKNINFELENNNQVLKNRLELTEKKGNDKDQLVTMANKDLELMRERFNLNKEEVGRLTEELRVTSTKLKNIEEKFKITKNALNKCNEELKSREEPLTEKAKRLNKVGDKLTSNVDQIQKLNIEMLENKSLLQETQGRLKKVAEELMLKVKIVDDSNFFGKVTYESIKKTNHIDITELRSKLNKQLEQIKSLKSFSDTKEQNVISTNSVQENLPVKEAQSCNNSLWRNNVVELVVVAFNELARSMSLTVNCKLASMTNPSKIEYKIFNLNKYWTERYKLLITKQVELQETVEKYKTELEVANNKVAAKIKELENNKSNYEEQKQDDMDNVKKDGTPEFNKETKAKLSQSFHEGFDQKKELETLNKQLIDLKNSRDKTINDLIEKHKKEIDSLNQRIKAATPQLSNAEVENLKKEIQKLTQELAAREKAKENLLKEFQDKEQKLNKSISEYKKQAEDFKKEADELQTALNDLLKGKEEALLRVATDHEKEITYYNTIKSRLEKTINEKTAIYNKTIAEHKVEVGKLTQQINDKAKEVEQVKEINQAKLAEVLSEMNGVKQKCDTLEISLKKREEEMGFMKEAEKISTDDHRKQLMMMMDESSTIRDEYNKYKAESVKRIEELINHNKTLELRQNPQTKKGENIPLLNSLKQFFLITRKDIMEMKKKLQSVSLIESLNKLKARILLSKNKESSVSDNMKYIDDMIKLCKEFTIVQENRLSITQKKIDKVNMMCGIVKEFMESNAAKDKEAFKAVIVKNMDNFPYLKSFDLKTNLKVIAICMLKISEYKSEKTKKYNEDNKTELERLDMLNTNLKIYQKYLTEAK